MEQQINKVFVLMVELLDLRLESYPRLFVSDQSKKF